MAPSRAILRPALLRQAQQSIRKSPILAATQCCKSNYHSYDHPPASTFNPHERAILSAAYQHVPSHGFTHQALAQGARDAGYLDVSANVLPGGPFSLIHYHLVTQREALAARRAALFAADNESPGAAAAVPARVEKLTWERLLGNRSVNHRWQEALAIMAQPSHVPTSLRELALLADEIHFLAGDASVDPTWYTKRGGLSVIYASCELFMTNDRSPEFADTRAFLQRRLAEAGSLSGAVGSAAQWLSFTASAGVNVLRSKGVRI
ncbi:ubiquinone biosynthesis protein COQ9 [Nemania sp. FL0916]|nr:ubiquinone biosynthesis protein COQ9 [Nemania sp. FL0916]